MRKTLMIYVLFLLVVAFLALSVSSVNAEPDINLSELPHKLSDALGLPSTDDYLAGKILATCIFELLFLLPVAFFTKGKNAFALLIVGLSVIGFSCATGWFPAWILLIICLIVALMFAGEMRVLITGRGQ